MKAVQLHAPGGIEALRYEEAGDPALEAPTHVIVKLKAAAINRIDLEIRRGLRGAPKFFPRILGCDGAGIVSTCGAAVTNVKPGDAVCIYPFSGCAGCDHCARGGEHLCSARCILGERENGTYAEFVRVPGKNCFPMPSGLSFEEAAALPLVYATTWRMLIAQAEIKPGEWLLIIGSGGVATAALQIAAAIGAHIIVTSGSDKKLAKAMAHGAEYGINHQTADFAAAVRRLTGKRGVDLVVDCVVGNTWIKSLAALARGGRLVTCGAIAGSRPTTDLRRIFWNNLKIFGAAIATRREFGELLKFFEFSRAKPIIDRVYTLRDAAKAQQRMEDRKHFGKIVLRTDA